MDFSRRFAWRLGARIAVLLATLSLVAGLVVFGEAPTATLLAALGAAAAAASLWRLVGQGNQDLARFVAALNRADLGQSFRRDGRGAGFDEVGAAYDAALDRLRGERARGAAAERVAQALVDGAPVALLLLANDTVRFVNAAARRLFGRSEPAGLDMLARFGTGFAATVAAARPGPAQIADLVVDGSARRVAIDTTLAEVEGMPTRIVSVKPIQAEIDGAEIAAQTALVRVLSHEVMNSLTPVVSLAASASELVAAVDPAVPGIEDAQLAIATLARRAGELERFVTSYKGFSEAPDLSREAIAVAAWLGELAHLYAATPAAGAVATTWDVAPSLPAIDGDRALLTQVMLNLLKNAGEAAAGGAVTVTARPVPEEAMVRIVVADSGPGIPPEIAHDVFLPFFTTKRTGTGIGLSLARQIVLRHGGRIAVPAGAGGRMELVLPAAQPSMLAPTEAWTSPPSTAIVSPTT